MENSLKQKKNVDRRQEAYSRKKLSQSGSATTNEDVAQISTRHIIRGSPLDQGRLQKIIQANGTDLDFKISRQSKQTPHCPNQ